MNKIDLYSSKYEGESETFLRERTSTGMLVFEVHLFSADFSSIMDWIPFDSMTDINSVIYNFNVNLDWGTDESECERLQEFYDQLIAINNIIPNEEMDVYNAIKQICQSALQNGNKLYYKG